MKNLIKIFTISLFCSMPLYAFEGNIKDEKLAYCINWADRFLSIKDGKNYKQNKISSAKFPKYVDLCLTHYVELQEMYKRKKLNK